MTMNMPARMPISEPVAFLPGVCGEDALAQYWLRQVTLRMRREVCWLWRERAHQGAETRAAALPPFADPALSVLDLARYERDKREFFASDVTAAHLGALIAATPPQAAATRGSFGWVVREGFTNIVRHSRARSCAVRLSQSCIEITDDGIGSSAPPGNGLTGFTRTFVLSIGEPPLRAN